MGKLEKEIKPEIIDGKRYNAEEIMRRYSKDIRKSSLRNVYYCMVHRCRNPVDVCWASYGGRGITVCKEWFDPDEPNPFLTGYLRFYDWAMATGYKEYVSDPDHPHRPNVVTIDRIDHDGPYAPWNCRWATQREQANNKRNNRFIIDLDGQRLTTSEFIRKHKITPWVFQRAKRDSWSYAAILWCANKYPAMKRSKDGRYTDENGFILLVPSVETQKKILKKG